MIDRKDFFYWLITICSVGLAAAFAQNAHLWELMYIKDATKISLLICGIFFFTSLTIGTIAYKKRSTQITMEKLWFISDALVTLGMIGTVTGFMIMMGDKFNTVNFADIASLQDLFKSVGAGIGTITVTTVMGLTTSLLIKLQLQFVDHLAVETDEK
jgi:hypothetical protein